MKKQLLLGFVISGVCLYFALRGIQFSKVGHALAQARPGWILLAVCLYSVGYLGRIWRWEILMGSIKNIHFRKLAAPLVIGFFANNILPFRMGEFVRAHISGRKLAISRTASLGTIFIERIFDTLSFLVAFLAAMSFYPFPTNIKKGAFLLAIACMGMIGILWLIVVQQSLFEALAHRLGFPHRLAVKIEALVQNFAHGVSGLRNPRQNLEALALSLVIWFIEGLFLYLMSKSLRVAIPLPGAFFLLFILGLSVTLPQAPGYVGTIEFFGVKALNILHVPNAPALSLILAIHGTQFLFVFIIGLWALHHEGLTVSKLISKQDSLD